MLHPKSSKTHYVMGLMSGTSLDGVDVVIADIDLPRNFSLLAAKTYPITDHLKKSLLALSQKKQLNELELYAGLDAEMGHLFADCCRQLIQESGIRAEEIYAIGSHGQTLRHYPDNQYPTTLQIGDPNIIAHKTNITTIADFRRRDMAAGGQGAPLVPPFHKAVFSDSTKNRAIVNIGGIANITFLPNSSSPERENTVIGYDTGPGNGLMDDWCSRNFDCDYDRAGQLAAQGNVDQTLLSNMLNDCYFSQQLPKSTGREYFSYQWIEDLLQKTEQQVSTIDTLSTLLELSCRSIVNEIKHLKPGVDEVLVCGGGAKNKQLMQRLQELMPEKIIASTEKFGLHPDWVEASAFAWLAHQTLNHLTSNLPSVTGADKNVILGGIWQA